MTRAPTLDPLGTVRAATTRATAFPVDVAQALRDHDVPEEAAWLAWEIARLAPGLDVGDGDALVRLVAALLVQHREGSTRLPLDGRLDERIAALGGRVAAVRALVGRLRDDAALASVVGPPGSRRPLVLDGEYLQAEAMYRAEARVAAALRARATAAPLDLDVAAAEAVLAEATPRLSDEQRAAVRAALGARLTVISGGPGTGKTSIVVSLLRALVRLGVAPPAIALAAPTGKAANRLDEAMRRALAALSAPSESDAALARDCPAPRTLHRLLGASPSTGSFRHHGNNRLAERVVVVDECSMIDLGLMDRLVRAVRDDARLVLLGDAEQLPSVDAGAVFRDLVGTLAAGAFPSVAAARLTRSFRVDADDPGGRAVLAAATALQAGDASQLPAPLADATQLAFTGVEILDGEGQLEAALARWHDVALWTPEALALSRRVYRVGPSGFLDEDRAALLRFAALRDAARILCVTRGDARASGAGAINARLHARRAALDGSARVAAWLPGEPVLVLRNDYARGLWNGDTGLVVRVTDGGVAAPRIVFARGGGELAAFPVEALADAVEPAYALTVHKAQGSEYDRVLIVLPDEKIPLCVREVLYTALTRARRAATLVGPRDVLHDAVARHIARSSGLGDKLAGP